MQQRLKYKKAAGATPNMPVRMKTAALAVLASFVFLLAPFISIAQTDLVRWNNTNFTPTVVAGNMTASNITVAGSGIGLNHLNWGNDHDFFEATGWTSGGLNTSKYVEFTVSPTAGYKIDPDKFNFSYRKGWGDVSFEVRYSKDNFTTYQTMTTGSLPGSWTNISGSLSPIGSVMPGQTLKIRIYVYNGGGTLHIKRLFNAGEPTNFTQTPTITGTVSPAVTGDPTDLGVTKTMSNTTPQPGNNVTYTVTVTNHGTNTASGASVLDQLPPGFTHVNNTASVGSYNSGTGVWTIGNLAPSATATLQITAQMQASGPYTNTATVSHYGSDPVSGNNTASATPTNVCGGCTHSIPNGGGYIEVLSGQTFCLHSGTFTGTFSLAAGGTICIAEGANFNPGEPSVFDGTIINRGAMSFSIWGGSHSATIDNYGTFTNGGLVGLTGNIINNTGATINTGQIAIFSGLLTNHGTVINSGATTFASGGSMLNTGNYSTTQIGGLSGLLTNHGTLTNSGGTSFNTGGSLTNSGTFTTTTFQNFPGTLNNSGTFTATGDVSFLSGAQITNTKKMTLGKVTATNTNVTTSDTLIINGGLDATGGNWTNNLNGVALINMTSGTTSFEGNLDNSGTLRVRNFSNLSATVNNYGLMEVHDQANNISSTTYITNDSLLRFININEVQYNGPMLTNNGRLTVSHGTNGNFKMNQAINQVYNNGIIVVTGDFLQLQEGSKLVNNCRIVSRNFEIENGVAQNNGLIWASQNVELNGTITNSILTNAATGHVRGTNFVISGAVNGRGSFYFTGHTDANSAGSMIGSDPSNPILFYDATRASGIFDEPGITVSNVIRPASMTPIDTTAFDCGGIPPSVAGYPPTTTPINIGICADDPITFNLLSYVTPHAIEPPNPNPFTLLNNTIRLFDANNNANPTNNTIALTIPGKGVFTVNTSTGVVQFTPDVAFTSGTAEAEYRISNSRTGDPIVYPSGRTTITVTYGSGATTPPITATYY